MQGDEGAIKQVYKAPVSGAALGQRLEFFLPYERLSPQVGRQRQRISLRKDGTQRSWLSVGQYEWMIFLIKENF